MRRTLRHAAAVVTVSQRLQDALARYASGREIGVTTNFVHTGFFALPPKPRLAKPFRFLAVGNLKPIKAFDLLVRAFADAFCGSPEVFLEVGGDGEERFRLESLVAELGLSDRVRFLGPLSREGVREAMWRANAFVLSSHAETFGVVLIEAMATGLPVIATRCGGPEDIVSPAIGRLVEPGNVTALAAVLRIAVIERDRFSAKKLRQYVIDRYGEKPFVERLLGLYDRVVSGS